jgi:hypothetical protein
MDQAARADAETQSGCKRMEQGLDRPALTPVPLPTFVGVWRKLLITRPGAPGTILTPRLLWRALTARARRAWNSRPAPADSCIWFIWSRLLAARCGASGRIFAPRLLWESLLRRSCQRSRQEDCDRYQRNPATHLSSFSVPHSVPQFIFQMLEQPQPRLCVPRSAARWFHRTRDEPSVLEVSGSTLKKVRRYTHHANR